MFNWLKSLLFYKNLNDTEKPNNGLARALSDYGNFRDVEYIRNYDGDTVTFNIKDLHPLIGKGINIRIAGIDTPEIRTKCEKTKQLAQEGKLLVQEFLENAECIDLINCRRGKYFRIIADVYADGVNIAEALLDKGLAVPYDGGTKIHDWSK